VLVFDGVKGEARKGPGVLRTPGALFVPTDRFGVSRYVGFWLEYFETGKTVMLSEPNAYINASGIASMPKGGTLSASYTYDYEHQEYLLHFALVP
jgi:hypothetical protein